MNLRVGYYDLSVQVSGFKTYTRTRIKVDAASRTTVDVGLEVGALTDSVSVTTEAPVTSLETAQIGRTIDTKQINELALNGRNPFSMAVLKAGVIGDQFNGFNPGWVEQSVSINGGRKNGNEVTVDGVNMLRARGDATRATNIGVLNVDSIQEVQILTSTYPAEYGRAMDGQVRFVTKSGSRTSTAPPGIYAEFRAGCQQLGAQQQPQSQRQLATGAVPLQPAGILGRRPRLYPGQIQQRSEQAVLFCFAGVGVVPQGADQHVYRAHGRYENRRFQRASQRVESLLPRSEDHP